MKKLNLMQLGTKKNVFLLGALFALQTPIHVAAGGIDQTEQNAQTEELPPTLISKATEGARVFIIEPKDGATISSPVTVKFGISNMTVAKAGDNQPNSGHHHLLIDLEQLPDMTAPLPATEQIIHFGGAQTETTIELEPGQHELQLLLGNYLHIPHQTPVISEKITVTVQ